MSVIRGRDSLSPPGYNTRESRRKAQEPPKVTIPYKLAEGGVQDVAAAFNETPQKDLDAEQLFQLFATFCGDVERTAHAADISVERVNELAETHGWAAKIRGLLSLRKDSKPGTVEREINRALNFVQAHRYRVFLERVIRKVTAMDEEELLRLMVTDRMNKNGEVVGQLFSTRPLADLASALEKAHWMTYQALHDTPQDRLRMREPIDEKHATETDIHARMAKAFSEDTPASMSPPATLAAAQAEAAAFLAGTPAK